MRILAQIVTLNDERAIEQSLAAVLAQEHPVDEVLIVDNGSTDGTLDREFPEHVTVVRHGCNLGTSGSSITALRYGLEHDYDWVWLFDADSAPRPDALGKLITLFEKLEPEQRARVHALACLPVDVTTGRAHHGIVFTPRGFEPVAPSPDQEYYEADTTIWSGSLFRMEAVRAVGLPDPDYVLDWGENEYGYRAKQAGYLALVHQTSILDHNTDRAGGPEGPREKIGRFGPLTYRLPDLPPIRLYYIYRNMTYFFLHEYFRGNVLRFLRFAGSWMPKHLVKLALAGAWRPELTTCLRGIIEGARKQMSNRY